LIFIVVVSLPMLFLGGLRETYLSTAWTLTYRELVAKAVFPASLLPDENLTADDAAPEPA